MLRALAITCLAGCITIPEPPAPECTVNSDCNTAMGEVCSANQCYGGPPSGTFGAVIVPPALRPDLIANEIANLTLPENGDFGTLQIEAPVRITGRIEAYCPDQATCSQESVAATVVITRAPLFAGGTGFTSSVSATEGLSRGNNSFTAFVPRSHDGDPPYVITVVPTGNGPQPPQNGGTSAAELSPTVAFERSPTTDISVGTIVLGSKTSPVITGTVSDSANRPLTRYRVVARGKLDPLGAVTDVSTVAYTTTGTYSLTLSDNIVGTISIVATPYGSGVTAPTLTFPGLDAKSGVHPLTQPADVGEMVTSKIHIEGLSGDGSVNPVAGAKVTVTAEVDSLLHDSADATFTAQGTTLDTGDVELALLDGSAFHYTMRVIPPAGSDLGVVFDQDIDSTMLSAIPDVRLPARVALSGRIVDAAGQPAKALSVTAKPSLRFQWSELDDAASFLAEIPAATANTDDAGDFIVYVDLLVAGVWGHYDVSFDQTSGSTAATYTVGDVELPREVTLTSLALPQTQLPDTAFLHGTITDKNNLKISGGELRVFQISADTSLCDQVPYPPANCTIPAQLIGNATTDDTGGLRLGLPRD
ncbi:MAG: hypothetical protein QM831_41815 [Kofleriaceae bacterium]